MDLQLALEHPNELFPMNQQWQQPPREPGRGGSVKRARERVAAGLPLEISQPPWQNPYEPPRSTPANRSRPQMPPALTGTRNGQGPVGVAISRPSQVPQWPLAAAIEGTPDRNPQYQPPKGAAPQRPPRPSHVPSILDASRLQDHTPAFQYKPQNASEQSQERARMPEDEASSPNVTSPIMSMSSRPSTISSVGTIPDFPVPMPPPAPALLGPPGPPGAPRRSANLGPPPTSRRGNSSYYSQASYVSPIPEESPRAQPSHESYASSAAMPRSWGSDSPGFRFRDEDDYEDDYRGSRNWRNEPIEEGRESRESNFDDSDDRGLIRSASLGKRAKPSMITTKGSDANNPSRPAPVRPSVQPQQRLKLERMGVSAPGAGIAAGTTASKIREDQRETLWPAMGDSDSPLASGTGFIDKSSSEESVPQLARVITTDEPASIYAANPSNPTANAMLGAYNAASGLAPRTITPSRTPSPGFSRLSAVRRPPRLDIDAVRDAEARGSLTSLPDLIRRATRLAAMMDRGRRPGSRLNDLNDFDDFSTELQLAREKELSLSPDEKHQSGLSGMLSAFPPPGLGTPTRGGTPTRPISSWPSPSDDSNGPNDPNSRNKQPRKRRRCCGLPCWGFVLVLLILLIIIAAAVVVPLELLVFHKPKSSSSTTATTALQACSTNTATACQNGGTSIIDNTACSCICTNGFTGPTCTVSNFTGCVTTTLPDSTYPNVTIGDAIPRLISDAQSNFSIPLFESVILARFSTANLTCASENALVTFDGESQRSGNALDEAYPVGTESTPTSSSSPSSTAIGAKPRGHEASATSSTTSSAVPSLITDNTSGTTTSTSATPTAIPSNPNAQFTVTQQVLDFARVAVLFVLQQEDVNSAINAQGALQHMFSLQDLSVGVASNLSIGGGNTVDLVGFKVDLGNGSVGTVNGSLERRAMLGRSVHLFDAL